MVFLALTPKGLSDALRLKVDAGLAIWCGSAAISAEDFERQKLFGMTRLNYSPGESERQSIECALDTIEQHHPGETVWVEARSEF